MTKRIVIFISILLISFSSLYSQNEEFIKVGNVDKLKTDLQDVADGTISIKNSFVQEKHLWMLEEIIISDGLLLFKKPGNVLWRYISPINYSISIFNNSFSINNDGNVSSFDINSNPMFAEINKMILTAIRGDFIDNDEFNSSFFENKECIKAVLIPENENVAAMITSIEIYFSKSDLQVSKVKFLEPGEDFTLIKFNDLEVNVDISDGEFNIENGK